MVVQILLGYSVRLTFKITAVSSSYLTKPAYFTDIRLYGDYIWSAPNSLSHNDHLYSWDESQNATFPALVSSNIIPAEDENLTNKKYVDDADSVLSLDIQDAKSIATKQINDAMTEFNTTLNSALEDYISSGDLESYRQTVNLQIEQVTTKLNNTYNDMQDRIDSLESTTQQQIQQLQEHLNLIDGDIVIRRTRK